MLVTIFSDLHIHNYKKFDVDNSRLNNCLQVLEDIFKFNDSKGITSTLFCGDFFDNEKLLPTIVVNRTIQKLYSLFANYPKQQIFAITGNHDLASKNLINANPVTALTHLGAIFIGKFIVVDNKSLALSNVAMSGIPYFEYPEHFREALGRASKNAPTYLNRGCSKNILLMHQTPNGLTNMNIPADIDISDPLFAPFDYIFNGHIHARQQLSDKFLIVGSPLHRDLGDVGQDKGFVTMHLDDIANGCEFHSLNKISSHHYPVFIKRDVDTLVSESVENGDYIVPVIDSSKQVLDETDVSVDDFGSDLSAQTLIKNYWDEVDGKNKDLLSVGLLLLN